MFQGCTSLQKAPVLPAKKVADVAYAYMFDGCTSLNYVKCLATDISEEGAVEQWMNGVPAGGTFVKASSLDWPSGANGIPEGWKVENATAEDGDMGATPLTLEAITDGYLFIENPMNLAIKYRMNDETWIETTADLIGIDIFTGDKVQFCGNNETYSDGHNHTIIHCEAECYIYGNIMSLISEDDFATSRTLTEDYTFANMFSGNELLKNHPDNELVLPATKLSNDCYNGMFSGCKSLTTAPALPATTMTERCYAYMFANCTGLTEAPRLPATALDIECYMEMFASCTSLEKAPDLLAKVLPINCYAYMFSGCEKLSYVKCLATVISDCATIGWLQGVADNGTFIKMSQMRNWPEGENGIPAGWTVQAATEADGDMGAVALTLEAVEDGIITISNPNGSMVNYQNISGDYWGSSSFTDTFQEFYVQAGDKIILSGNQPTWGNVSPGLGLHISSTNDVYVYGNVMSLVKSWDFADVTTLEGSENFACLFGDDGTTNTTIRNHPTKDIVLGATSLTESCYAMIFAGCEGLTRAPELPATTLAPMCYHRMFGNCTGLTRTPILPAPVLETECYFVMFDGCTNLRNVKCLATDISADGCTCDWLKDVAETGTFIMADDMSSEWPAGMDGIPINWGILNNSDMIPGDADLDWIITNDDATAISNLLIGLQPERFNEYAADLNGDGRITLADLISILKLILGQ